MGRQLLSLPPSQTFLVWDKMQPENFSLAMCEQAWCSFKKPAKMHRLSVTSYEKEHPTQKPVRLMEWCIDHAPESGTICDPYMGSGTTGVAAVKMARHSLESSASASISTLRVAALRTSSGNAG